MRTQPTQGQQQNFKAVWLQTMAFRKNLLHVFWPYWCPALHKSNKIPWNKNCTQNNSWTSEKWALCLETSLVVCAAASAVSWWNSGGEWNVFLFRVTSNKFSVMAKVCTPESPSTMQHCISNRDVCFLVPVHTQLMPLDSQNKLQRPLLIGCFGQDQPSLVLSFLWWASWCFHEPVRLLMFYRSEVWQLFLMLPFSGKKMLWSRMGNVVSGSNNNDFSKHNLPSLLWKRQIQCTWALSCIPVIKQSFFLSNPHHTLWHHGTDFGQKGHFCKLTFSQSITLSFLTQFPTNFPWQTPLFLT